MQQNSQIVITKKISDLAMMIKGHGVLYFENVIKWINKNIMFREYNQETSGHEKSIRWRRTADQILKDGYIYRQKGCTDMVILFQALCEAKGYKTNFIKVKENGGKGIHSIAEAEVTGEGWYKIDVAGRAGVEKGKFTTVEKFGKWIFWKRGRDAWDLGYTSYESIRN
jgi:hypothetical protein